MQKLACLTYGNLTLYTGGMQQLRRRLATVDETLSHSVLLNMGDLDAQVGNNNEGREIEMQGIRDTDDYGNRLATFCQKYRLVTGGTIFKDDNENRKGSSLLSSKTLTH